MRAGKAPDRRRSGASMRRMGKRLARSCCHSIKLAARGGRGHRPHARLSRNRQQAQPNRGRIAPSAARLRDPRINSDGSFRARNATSPVHPEGVHMSRLMVLTLACVAGASLATSSLRAEQDQDQVTPQTVVSALEGAYGVHLASGAITPRECARSAPWSDCRRPRHIHGPACLQDRRFRWSLASLSLAATLRPLTPRRPREAWRSSSGCLTAT